VKFAVESYARFGTSLREDQIQNIRELAKSKLADAIRAKGKNPADYTIIDLFPSDLGLSTEEWSHTYSAANTEEEFANLTVPDEKFIAIYGYTNTNSSPITLYAKFYKGASVEKIVHFQAVYAQEEPFAYFDPQVWSEGDRLKIVIYGNAAATDNPVFLGFVAVPKGEKITK